jgi:hypothetical protein
MKIVRLVACGVVVLAAMMWLTAGAEAQGDKCKRAVEKMVNQPDEPSNEEVARLKTDCPEDLSTKDIKRYREYRKQQARKKDEARGELNLAGGELEKKPGVNQ